MVLFPHQFCFWIFAMHIDDDFLDTTQRYVMRHLCEDRKSTRLNSSHLVISYAVFCLKKKKHNSFTSLSNNTRHNNTHTLIIVMNLRAFYTIFTIRITPAYRLDSTSVIITLPASCPTL